MIPILARKHRVVAVDLLGHGGSEKPSSGYSIENQADLVAGVLGRLGVRNAEVVGHSLGGSVAVALTDPQRRAELADVGVHRMLSPEQVERKVNAIFGTRWGRLHEQLAILYGGIDSKEITERATDPSGAMGAIQRDDADVPVRAAGDAIGALGGGQEIVVGDEERFVVVGLDKLEGERGVPERELAIDGEITAPDGGKLDAIVGDIHLEAVARSNRRRDTDRAGGIEGILEVVDQARGAGCVDDVVAADPAADARMALEISRRRMTKLLGFRYC